MGFEGCLETGDGEFRDVRLGPDAGDIVEVVCIGRARDGIFRRLRNPDGLIGRSAELNGVEIGGW